MLHVELSESAGALHGEKAIKALSDFINELKEQKDEELTDKQTIALIKLAKELIFSIEAEIWVDTLEKEINELCSVSQLKKKVRNTLQNASTVFSKTSIT